MSKEYTRPGDKYITVNELRDPLERDNLKCIWEDERYNEFIQRIPNPIILSLGGSYAYGTNTETSDIDLRGIYINPAYELFGSFPDSEQEQSKSLDATIYSITKMMRLLGGCNPNTIEILGLKEDDYLYLSDEGKEILNNSSVFLSKRAYYTFGNYALSSLDKLMRRGHMDTEFVKNNKADETSDASEPIEDKDRSDSIQNRRDITIASLNDIQSKYSGVLKKINIRFDDEDMIYLSIEYADATVPVIKEINTRIFNVTSNHNLLKNKRNDYAINKGNERLGKHMMHLIRLYMTGIDVLKDGIIKTYRDGTEHDLLMEIRSGKYLDEYGYTTNEFEDIVTEYKYKFNEAMKVSKLPESPNWDAISKLQEKIVIDYFL